MDPILIITLGTIAAHGTIHCKGHKKRPPNQKGTVMEAINTGKKTKERKAKKRGFGNVSG